MVEPNHGIFTDHCARTHILHEGRAFTPWPGLGFFTTGLADLLLGTLRSNVSNFPHSSNHLSTFVVYPKGLYTVQCTISVFRCRLRLRDVRSFRIYYFSTFRQWKQKSTLFSLYSMSIEMYLSLYQGCSVAMLWIHRKILQNFHDDLQEIWQCNVHGADDIQQMYIRQTTYK